MPFFVGEIFSCECYKRKNFFFYIMLSENILLLSKFTVILISKHMFHLNSLRLEKKENAKDFIGQ